MIDPASATRGRPDPALPPSALRERPVWFGPEERPLFGWWGRPSDGGIARGAILLCSPIGTDARAGHRAVRMLGTWLRDAGFATLRFDYDGIGDSAGRWSDGDRVDSWTASVRTAAELLRDAGAPRISGVGLGIGATLLASAASSLPLDRLVLWDPVADGRQFLREQQLLLPPEDGPDPGPDDGAVEVPGFAFSPELVSDLARLDLADVVAALRPEWGTTLLWPGDRPLPRRLRAAVGTGGVDLASSTGRAELLQVHPDASVLPLDTMRAIVERLEGDPSRPFDPAAEVGRTSAVFSPAPGVTIRERAEVFGAADLFAIVTDPIEGAPEHPDAPRLVMINNGGETHIGPGRLWVDWSRRWAADGIPSCRVDMSGFGDSGTHPGQEPFRTYAGEWFEDVDDILGFASPDRPGRAVVLGLCSSAYVALESAFAATPPAGVVVINPMLRGDTANDPRYADPRRRAWRADPRALRRLAPRRPRTARRIARVVREFVVTLSPMDVFARAVRAGVDVYVLYTPPDLWQYGDDVYWHAIGMPRLRRTGRFSFVVDPRVDHALHRRAARVAAHDRIRAHLMTAFYPGGRQGPRA